MSQNPDHALYHSATGAALTFAEAHINAPDSQSPFTLYGSWFCPFVQRVWIILHLKSVPHRYVEINPYHKAKEFLARNPRGLVPTLAVNDPKYAGPFSNEWDGDDDSGTTSQTNGTTPTTKEKILYESTIISHYLDTLYPTPHPLYSSNPYTRAHQNIWIDFVSTKIIPAFYRFLQHTPEKAYSIESCRGEFVGHLQTFVNEMHPTGPWFGGKQISIVDVSLIPWAERVFLIDHYKPGGSGVGGGDVADGDGGNEAAEKAVWERWSKWVEAVRGCESVKATMSDRQKYVDAYQRYAEDTTGSQVGRATREGRGLP